jgi:hypothetical protein
LKGTFSKYIGKEEGYENELRSYFICKHTAKVYDPLEEVIPDVDSRFELVLGQTGSKDSVPFSSLYAPRGNGFWWPYDSWMSNSSIQIVDRLTGEILAEDTMYFLEGKTGVGGCLDGMEQLSNLLIEVFDRQCKSMR